MADPNLQPTLKGETVLIRPLEEADWEEIYAVASDPMIWAGHPARERYKKPEFWAFFGSGLNTQSAFAFVDRQTGKIIGSSRYYGFDAELSEIEIGWTFLARAYWGGNTNREIKTLMIQHAFTFVETVVFWVAQDNIRSRRAMEKIGGVLREGLFDRAVSPVPHVIYEIKKEALHPA